MLEKELPEDYEPTEEDIFEYFLALSQHAMDMEKENDLRNATMQVIETKKARTSFDSKLQVFRFYCVNNIIVHIPNIENNI